MLHPLAPQANIIGALPFAVIPNVPAAMATSAPLPPSPGVMRATAPFVTVQATARTVSLAADGPLNPETRYSVAESPGTRSNKAVLEALTLSCGRPAIQ
jgi:hypothetical protein